MFRLPEWRRLLRLEPSTRRIAAEIDAEVAFHLEMRVAELVRSGMSEVDARVEAHRRFGDVPRASADLATIARSRLRRARCSGGLSEAFRELRFALRGLRRARSFTIVAVLTLSLGLGLTTAVLAVVNRLILSPFPYPAADRLLTVFLASEGRTAMRIWPDLDMARLWKGPTPTIEWSGAHTAEELLLELGDAAELVPTRSVTPGLIAELGGRVVLGRDFVAEDTVPGRAPVGLLAWPTWQRRFGADPGVIGSPIRLDGRVVTVIGVVVRGFDLASLDARSRAEVWLPLVANPRAERSQSVGVLIRRRPTATPTSVSAELRADLTAAGIRTELAGKFAATADDPSRFAGGDRARAIWLLTAAVVLVLAVACANVAALVLGRSIARAREFGVRAALGAGRGRVAAQLATESVLLGLLGGLGGVIVAQSALLVTRWVRPAPLLLLDDVGIDWTVLGESALLVMAATVGFGLVPVMSVARRDASAAVLGRLRKSHDTAFGRSFRSGLVVTQLALSIVLLIGAGILLKSFLRDRGSPTGFDERGLAWVSLDVPRATVEADLARSAIAVAANEAARRVPGVRSSLLVQGDPLGYGVMESEFLIEGRPMADRETKTLIPFRPVSAEYFSMIGMEIVAGRSMGSDTTANEILIDIGSAKRLWPDGGAIGSRIRYSRTSSVWHTIVGLLGEPRSMDEAFASSPIVYALPSGDRFAGTILLRVDDVTRLPQISRAIRAVDSRISIKSVVSAEAAVAERFAGRRFTAALVGGFAVLALGLAAIGLYGVIALTVSQRTYELGVRMALGATATRVRAQVLEESLRRIAAGTVLGLVGVLALGRAVRGIAAGIPTWDGVVAVVAVALLTVVGLVAAWAPAHRAGRVDPTIAIRAD